MCVVRELGCYNFKAVKNQRYKFDDSVSIIAGENGIGKTSILQSICLFSGLRSISAQKQELQSWNALDPWRIDAIFGINTGEELSNIELHTDDNGVYCNNDLLTRKYMHSIVAHIFITPDLFGILNGAQYLRRKLLDKVIGSYMSSYKGWMDKYSALSKRRLSILLRYSYDTLLLDIIERDIARYCALILFERHRVCSSINQSLESIDISMNLDADSLGFEQYATQQLQNDRSIDVQKQSQSFGINNYDINIISRINNKDSLYLSMGQKQFLLMEIAFAWANIIEYELEILPIILFDDIFSHIDGKNINIAISKMHTLPYQILCTTTNTMIADILL